MQYAEPEDVGREALERARIEGDVERICSSLIGVVFHDEDWKWLQDTSLSLLEHEAVAVRKCAAISLGHIARIHQILDTDIVVPTLKGLRSDPEIGGTVDDALGDISMFIP